jgi:hypothetical protein
MKLPKVEDCIEWAMQLGYCFARDAADEYGKLANRKLVDDDNTACYGTHTWVDTESSQ